MACGTYRSFAWSWRCRCNSRAVICTATTTTQLKRKPHTCKHTELALAGVTAAATASAPDLLAAYGGGAAEAFYCWAAGACTLTLATLVLLLEHQLLASVAAAELRLICCHIFTRLE